jgi:putative flippase GtrA
VIVPCYQEEKRFDTQAFARFLNTDRGVEFILVDDGSRDQTAAVLKQVESAFPDRVTAMSLPVNQGKAEAVRQGVLRAFEQGADYVGYWDADLATPLESIPDFAAELDRAAELEIVLGARVALLGRRIKREARRHHLGRIFATAASLTLNLPVYDTQCGAKLLRVNPRTKSLFEKPFLSRWIFDVEILARYLTAQGTVDGLYEYDVPSWEDVAGSQVRSKDFVRAGGEMMKIFRRYPLGQPLRWFVVPVTSAFGRYLAVGGLGTALHYAVLVLGVELAGLGAGVAAAIGATVGANTNYVLNYHITFTSKTPHSRALPRFLMIAALGAVLSWYGVKTGVGLGVHYVLAQVACTILVIVLGFVLNRAFTF